VVRCLHKVKGVIFSPSLIFLLICAGESSEAKTVRATFHAPSTLDMSSIVQCREEFGHLLKAIHDKLSPALWLVVFDVKFTGADAAKVTHLLQIIGLNSKDFACLFNACDLNGERREVAEKQLDPIPKRIQH
jgi:hypothetical protein